jgi:hypothetical protein
MRRRIVRNPHGTDAALGEFLFGRRFGAASATPRNMSRGVGFLAVLDCSAISLIGQETREKHTHSQKDAECAHHFISLLCSYIPFHAA